MIKLRKDSKDKGIFRLDLAPMINIVFLLLIFFLLTSTAIKQGDAIDLPKAENSKENEKESIVVRVSPNQRLQLNQHEIPKEHLQDSLSEKLQRQENKVVVIEGDKTIEFALFGEVIDIAKQAGAVDFILATEPLNLQDR